MPFFGALPAPSCAATHRRTFAGRPMRRLCPSGPRTWATPGAVGSRARSARTSPPSRGTRFRRGPDTMRAQTGKAASGLRGLVLHLIVDGDQADDLVFLDAGRDADLDDVSLLVVEQALADRRGRRNAPLRRVRLLRSDEIVRDRVSGGGVLERDGGAQPHLVPRDLVEVHEAQRAQPAMELADPGLQEALALLGRLVLGVLAQVAVLARALDLLGKLDLELVVERPDLFLEPLLYVDHSVRDRRSSRPLRADVVLVSILPCTPRRAPKS